MKNIKIAYIMNVEWNWIKQRPHFIAEGLSERYKIKILFQYRYRRRDLQKRDRNGLDLFPVYCIPYIGNFHCLAGINVAIRNRIIKTVINKYKPNVIYTTYPDQVSAIPSCYDGQVIYDCMDNHAAFTKDVRSQGILIKKEAQLISKADRVFVSSQKLADNLCERYGHDVLEKTVLIRNGFNGNIITPEERNNAKDFFDICYFGTISTWLNVDYIMKCLSEFKHIRFFLFGPLEIQIPTHERLIYGGIIEHSQLYDYVKEMDCLIMPFIINDIIEAVDPVKLYEYINFNKPIICCEYPEVERFEDFVEFYTDYASFHSAIEAVMEKKHPKYNNKSRIKFLKENSWSDRIHTIEGNFAGLNL